MKDAQCYPYKVLNCVALKNNRVLKKLGTSIFRDIRPDYLTLLCAMQLNTIITT